MSCRPAAVVLLALLAGTVGCAPWNLPAETVVATTASSRIVADERIVLEAYFVHMPAADQQLAETIWNDVDEQQLPIDIRQRLAQQGFRVGVLGTQLPAAIQELLSATGSTATAAQSPSEQGEAKPFVSRQEMRLRPGSRGEIVSSPLHDRLTVVSMQNGELTGRTYETAQGRLRVVCRPQGDGRVRVDLTPELQHGRSRRRGVGEDGVLRLELGQDKLLFEELRMPVVLAPNQMLLVGCREHPLRSLGRDFFTDTTGGKTLQKLVVLKLVPSQHDDPLTSLTDAE